METTIVFYLTVASLMLALVFNVVTACRKIKGSSSITECNGEWLSLISTLCMYGAAITMYINFTFTDIYIFLWEMYPADDWRAVEYTFVLVVYFCIYLAHAPAYIIDNILHPQSIKEFVYEILDTVASFSGAVFITVLFLEVADSDSTWLLLIPAFPVILWLLGVFGENKTVYPIRVVTCFLVASVIIYAALFGTVSLVLNSDVFLEAMGLIEVHSNAVNLLGIFLLMAFPIKILLWSYRKLERRWCLVLTSKEDTTGVFTEETKQ